MDFLRDLPARRDRTRLATDHSAVPIERAQPGTKRLAQFLRPSRIRTATVDATAENRWHYLDPRPARRPSPCMLGSAPEKALCEQKGSLPVQVGLLAAREQNLLPLRAVTNPSRGLRSPRCTVDDRAPFSGRV
jgi:hypothetical protein